MKSPVVVSVSLAPGMQVVSAKVVKGGKVVSDADQWITVHPRGEGKGVPVLLGENGEIKAGMGGKFNGKNIKSAFAPTLFEKPRGVTAPPAAAPAKSTYGKTKKPAPEQKRFETVSKAGPVFATKNQSESGYNVSWASTHIANAKTMEEAERIAEAVSKSGAENIAGMRQAASEFTSNSGNSGQPSIGHNRPPQGPGPAADLFEAGKRAGAGDAVEAAYKAARVAAQPYRSVPKFSEGENLPVKPNAPAGVFMFKAGDLKTDAHRFQYKDNGDVEGVTHALKGVTKWDPAKANQVIAWEDKNGELFVVDGHQRTGLARRLINQGYEKNIEISGILYREKDGISADDIRAIAAAKNIAEGSGSPIDGAKVIRTRPDLMDGSMPISRTEAKQSFELARLNDEAFRMVTNEVVPYQQAAVVGRYIPDDPERQNAAMKALSRFEPRNETEAQVLVQRVAQAELEKANHGAQASMFGELEEPESTAGEEMRIVAKAITELKQDKTLFSRVVKNAERIEETGSSIEREAASEVKTDAEIFIKRLASEAYSAGPVRSKLVAAAKELRNGGTTIGEAVGSVISALRGEAKANVPAGVGDRRGATPVAAPGTAGGKFYPRGTVLKVASISVR